MMNAKSIVHTKDKIYYINYDFIPSIKIPKSYQIPQKKIYLSATSDTTSESPLEQAL